MGKMKALWQAMREKEMYEMEYGIPQEPLTIDILCPNCMKSKLVFNTTTDIKCYDCNDTFELVDATTVKFKCKNPDDLPE
jgi:ribosomal protein S27E